MSLKFQAANALHLTFKFYLWPGELPGHNLLTGREQELLSLLVQGLSTDEAAAGLGISPNTARTHRQNILAKFNVHSIRRILALLLDGRAG